MDSQVSHTPISGQQAYAALAERHGYLKAESFVGVLVDGRGNADFLACHLMEWILDWYRPTEDGRSRLPGGVLWLDSAGLAAVWHTHLRRFVRARQLVSRSGLVTFHRAQHRCLVEVHWAALEAVLGGDSRLSDNGQSESRLSDNGQSGFRLSDNGQSESPRLSDNGQSGRSDYPITVNKPPLPTSFNRTPPSAEGGGGGVEKSGQGVSHTLAGTVERCLDYGRSQGRACGGRWVQDAHAAFSAAVASGRDPALVESAWRAYDTRRGSDATDLGHWLRGQSLRGERRDEGEDSFEVCYTRAGDEASRAAERARVAAGEPPTPRFMRTSEGWAVSAEGVPAQLFDAVPQDATRAEAEAAWPAWWRERGGV